MKRLSLLICVFTMALATHSQNNLKLMSYNIRNATGTDNILDVRRIASIIAHENPDVVAVQEIDSMTTRSKQQYILGEIAKRTQMHATYAPAIDFQGGKYGVGILSRKRPITIEQHSLPGREERRTLLIVEFKRYIFCCTHFSLTEEDQMASVDIIKQVATGRHKPLFLAGDLNASPDSKVITSLAEDFILLNDPATHTFPAHKPSVTIDYIVAWKHGDGHLTNIEPQVIEEPIASDHRPLTVKLRIKKAKKRRNFPIP